MVWFGWCLILLAVVTGGRNMMVKGANVSYDGRSLLIDGQRRILFSGSIHYPRSTPDMWPSLIDKAKQGGLDVIQTYVFWNLHEPQPGQYDFTGRNDIVSFIKQVQQQGLYVSLRIGPFIEAEWSYGGLPFWLHDVPGIVFRTNNEPFKFYMQNFTTKIVDMMKAENLFASQGGPIILSQVIPHEVVQALLAACKSGSFDNANKEVNNVIAEGYPVSQMLSQLFDMVVESEDTSDEQKARICKKFGETDKCLVDGADEYLQLLAACSSMIKAYSNMPEVYSNDM